MIWCCPATRCYGFCSIRWLEGGFSIRQGGGLQAGFTEPPCFILGLGLMLSVEKGVRLRFP